MKRKRKNFSKPIILSALFLLSVFLFFTPEKASAEGKIFFSSSEEFLKMTSENLMENDFTLSDNLFVAVHLGKPLKDYYDQHNYVYRFDDARYDYNYAIRIFVDGDLKARWLYEMPPEPFERQQSLHFALATKSKELKREFSTAVNNWVSIVSGLEPGEHNVKFDIIPLNMELVGEDLPVLASGEFTLDIDENKKQAFVKEAPTDLPLVTMIAPEIERKIVEASTIVDNSAPARAFITDVSGDWTYVKDENGNILYRHLVASVLYKERDGDCRIRSAWYMQEHQGYDNWGPMEWSKPAEGYHNYEVPCDILGEEEE
ncbi:MAG: hypothetical protein ACOC0C_08785, partial [Bacteroidota bacterium]